MKRTRVTPFVVGRSVPRTSRYSRRGLRADMLSLQRGSCGEFTSVLSDCVHFFAPANLAEQRIIETIAVCRFRRGYPTAPGLRKVLTVLDHVICIDALTDHAQERALEKLDCLRGIEAAPDSVIPPGALFLMPRELCSSTF